MKGNFEQQGYTHVPFGPRGVRNLTGCQKCDRGTGSAKGDRHDDRTSAKRLPHMDVQETIAGPTSDVCKAPCNRNSLGVSFPWLHFY